RKALPAPLAERPVNHPFVAPRTPLEEYLAGLWRELLNVQAIGVLDNFFDLGGSSIQAAILINRLQEKLGEQVYTVAVFDSPTIAGLVDHLAKTCPDALRSHFGEFGRGGTGIPACAAQAGMPVPPRRNEDHLLAALQPKGT